MMVAYENIPEFDSTESNFANEFAKQLKTNGITKKEQKWLDIIEADPSKRRNRKLSRMEGHARAAMGMNPNVGAIDWGTIKWAEWIKPIMDILETIFPWLKLLFGETDEHVNTPAATAGTNQVTGTSGNTVATANSSTK